MEPEVVRLLTPVNEVDHVYGPEDASVTLLEYGDYECVHCKETEVVLKEIRLRLRGQLRFVFRHFPLSNIHPLAQRAAEAAEAAAAQGRFWEMHELLFEHSPALSETDLAQYAKKAGLDVERFKNEMAQNLYAAPIQKSFNSALFGGGITGTPTFFLNSIRYNDTADLERLMDAIKVVNKKPVAIP